jgi:putative cell wall-binding protein/protocatechuate 3,4-dioxygenase beta subunit
MVHTRLSAARRWQVVAVGLAMVATTLPVVASPAGAQPATPDAVLGFPHPLVSELPGRRGDNDRFEMLDHGDLDGDGTVDLAVLRHDSTNGSHHTSVAALLGNGDGTFTPTYELDITAARNIDGGVVIDELTGDAHPDLASATDDLAQVLIHPGNGDGTFGATTPVPVTAPAAANRPGPNRLRSAALTDGEAASLVAGFSSGVTILRADGDGGFAEPLVVATDVGLVQDLIVADLDADGRADLVVVGRDALQVLTQDADGAFEETTRLERELSFGNGYTAAVAGDFTGDGHLDVVVGRDGAAGIPDGVGIFAGAGDGALTRPEDWAQTPSGTGVRRNSNDHLAGDLDGDGHPDALFTGGATVVAVFGDGDGGLDVRAWLATTPEADIGDSFTGVQATSNAIAADVDGDGHPDLVVGADGGIFASVNVLLADPVRDRRWSAAQVFRATSTYVRGFSIALAEFTGDGHLDILTMGIRGGLQVAAGRGDGTFEDPYIAAPDPAGCYGGYLNVTGDFDGDGNTDFVCHAVSPFVYYGDGAGGVSVMEEVELGDPEEEFHLPSDVLAVDLDGDGADELVVSSTRYEGGGTRTTQVTVLRYDGDMGGLVVVASVDLGRPRESNKDSSHGLVAEDFDGDGTVDLSTWFTLDGATTAQRVVIPGDGDAGLGTPVHIETGLPHEYGVASVVGDVDGDGLPDIVSVTTMDGGRRLVVERGLGDGTFALPVGFPTDERGDTFIGMALADMDLDGVLDAVVETERSIEVHLGDGEGGFAPPMHLQKADFSGHSVAVADLDGDGRPDIVADAARGVAVHLSGGEVAPPPVDLAVVDVTVPGDPVRAGDDAEVEVTVANLGTVAALGAWVDEVVMETSRGPVLIGSAVARGPLPPGDQYTVTIGGAWPASLPGSRDLVVRTDARQVVADATRTNNEQREPVIVAVDDLPYDTDVAGTVAANRSRVHRIEVTGAAAVLAVTAPTTIRRATALGAVPPDDQLVPAAGEVVLGPGVHYALLAGSSTAGGGAPYTLRLADQQPGVHSVAPSRVGRGPVTVAVQGAGFGTDTAVAFRRDGTTLPAESVQRSSSTRLLVSVDLADAALGSYDIVVSTGGTDHVLEAGIEVVDVEPGRFEVFVSVPSVARLFRSSPVQVTVLNAGGLDALVPLVRIDVDQARLGRTRGGAFRTRSLDLLAVADDGSLILAPGETAHLSARFDPDPDIDDGDPMQFTARAYGVGNATPWRWADAEDRLRPDGLPDDIWEAAFEELLATVGSTAGSYALALHGIHTDLAERGLVSDRTDDVLARMVARAIVAVPGADLAGTVRDADGPLAERDVLAVDPGGQISQVRTTIDGDFAFHALAPGAYDVRVRNAVPTPAGFTQVPRGRPMHLTVGHPVTLTGRVRYPDGRGAGRVPVTVEHLDQGGRVLGSVQTDGSGSYTIANLPQGALRVVARAPDHLPATTVHRATTSGRFPMDDLTVAEGLTVDGTVWDPHGAPVGNARIIVRVPEGNVTSVATTQGNGTYTVRGLPEGPVEVTAVRDGIGQGTAAHDLAPPGGEVNLTIAPGGAVAGTVTSGDGGPLAGAVVLTDALRADEIRTAADGTFRVDAVPEGDTRVEVRADGHVPTSVPVTITEGAVTPVDVTLPALGILHVTVEGSDGPLADVPVTATLIGGLGGAIRTGSDGVAVLRDLVPGSYLVHAGSTAGPDGTRAVVHVGSGMNTLTLGADLTAVRGQVTDPGGSPVAGAEVAVLSDDEPLLVTSTDADGFYELLLEPGTVDVRAISPDDAIALVRDVTVTTEDANLPLTLGTSTLQLTVQGPYGPAPGVDVTLGLEGAGDLVLARTDAGGVVSFTGLPAGASWSVVAAGPGLAPATGSGVLSGGTTTTQLVLQAGRSASGRVRDADHEPVSGGLVGTVDPATGETVLTTTDDQGRWALDSLSPGVVTLYASDGTDVIEQSLDLTGGSVTEVDLVLDRPGTAGAGATVEGVVTDPSGTPLLGRMVQLVRDGLPVTLTTTGADGAYAFDGVPEGAWTLVVALGGSPSLHQPVDVPTSASQPPVTETVDLVGLPAVGWTLEPPFEPAPPGGVTGRNASLAAGPDVAATVSASVHRISATGDSHAPPVTITQSSTFGEYISGLPRPQKNHWAAENETAWREFQDRANPIDWDCPPIVFSLERELQLSESRMNQAFYNMQESYHGVQQVYTAGMGQALAEGAYTGLKTWVTLSSMAGGGTASAGTVTYGGQTLVVNQTSNAANALASVGLPVIDFAAGSAGNMLFTGDSPSPEDIVSTYMGLEGGAAGLLGNNVTGNALGAVGMAYDWKKFKNSLNDINQDQLSALANFSFAEDNYIAAVERHHQLTRSFAVATAECDPDPPEEEPEKEEGPDDEGGDGGGGGGGDDDPPTPPEDDQSPPDGRKPPRPKKPSGPDGQDEATSTGGASIDPNEIVGPAGVGEAGWIAAPARMGYQISFENLPTATLPATIVTITTELDEDTDWSTFELGGLGWAEILVDVPPGLQEWSGRVPLPGVDNVVDVEAGLDPTSGVVTWTLTTIDPAIDDIPDESDAGFLPPNNALREGEGFVDYSIAPASTVTGTEITAQASIVFDVNEPIITNEWRNTIDDDRPLAGMAALPAESTGPTIEIEWTASDVGSGVVTYDLFATVDDSALFLYRQGVTGTSATVPVVTGRRYGFAVIATDAVGLQEADLDGVETRTLIVAAGGGTDPGNGGGTSPGDGGGDPPPTGEEPPDTGPDEPTPPPGGGGPTDPDPSPTDPPEEPPSAPADPAVLRRLEGGSRIETAIALSQATFPSGFASSSVTRAKTALLARADVYADALAGGPLARLLTGPILLTASDELSAPTAAELRRLGVDRVILLGGDAALSPQVTHDVVALGIRTVERVRGVNRFATAAAVAERLGPVDGAYVAQGAAADASAGWPDAVAVSALAAHQRRPILLVMTDRLPDETAAALAGVEAATIVGGHAAVGPTVETAIADLVPHVDRLAGAHRYATSSAIATRHSTVGGDPQRTWLVTGANWPDALAAGPAASASGGVLHLVDGVDLDASTHSWLSSHQPRSVTIVGGTAAISDSVEQQIAAIVRGQPLRPVGGVVP